MYKKNLSFPKEVNSLLNSLPFQGKEATEKRGFTLVELIVVITILAILGTIAFISLQGYSVNARDSTRISDLSAMKTSLELFNLDAGKYPETTSGFVVTYSGSEVWTQGVFGENTKSNVEKLDKIPTDPLTGKEYTYSITKTKQEYQLAGLIESEIAYISHPNPLPRGEGIATLFDQTNAVEIIATAVVTGNYNGKILKTQSGVVCEILSLPSIISSETDITDLETILNNKSLVYNGYNNLPSNYKGSKYKTNEGFEFLSQKLVVYSDNLECKPLYDAENASARINFLKNLQTAYSGTLIENSSNIRGIVALDQSDIQAVNLLSATLVNNNLGGNISVKKSETPLFMVSGSFGVSASGATINVCGTNVTADTSGNFTAIMNYGNTCNTITATRTGYSCNTTINGPAILTSDITNITGSCAILNPYASCGAANEIKTAITTYGSCDTPDIIVCSGTGTGYTIAACNVGTIISGLSSNSYGNYFQWGRNKGFIFGDTSQQSTQIPNASYNSNNDTYGYVWNANLDTLRYDWLITKDDDLWGNTTNTNIARQGPCEFGYHIPSKPEWAAIVIAGGWGSNGTNLMNTLKMPLAGLRNRSIVNMSLETSVGYYWASTPATDTTGQALVFYNISINANQVGSRASGFSLRCIKN